MQLQQTLRKSYSFEGKGLHTGRIAKMTVNPAPADTGIRFRRTDIGEDAYVPALAENVSSTARSTTISCGDASVMTIEHILSALTGMGVDNALIDIDNIEVPILDGSAKPYIDTIWNDGFETQDAPRRYIEIKETVEIRNETPDLTAKEFDLFVMLMRSAGTVFSRDKLLENVWGYGYPGDIRTVDVHIRRIREKIEKDDANPEYIMTKWGVGYYFNDPAK